MTYADDLACLYLHGFLSSPQSEKARELQEFYAANLTSEQLAIPVLPFEPNAAIQLAQDKLRQLQETFPRVFVMGSSLGGFYATWLSQTFNLPAVLINPAVNPHGLFRHYLGPNTHYYTGQVHQLKEEHLLQLSGLACQTVRHPGNILLLQQTGDETLDYRHAASLYHECSGWLEQGGSHRFDQFEQRLPMMLQFAERWSPAN